MGVERVKVEGGGVRVGRTREWGIMAVFVRIDRSYTGKPAGGRGWM